MTTTVKTPHTDAEIASLGSGGSTPDDTAYDATSWNANTDAATKNAIRDKIVTMDAAIAAVVDNTAYNAGTWDAVTGVAPSKNVVRDQFEAMVTAYTALVDNTAYDATSWDAVTALAPSKNAVRDKIEAMVTAYTGQVSDTTYNATSWDGVVGIAPSKNAVRDQVEAILISIAAKADAVVLKTGYRELSDDEDPVPLIPATDCVLYCTNTDGLVISLASATAGQHFYIVTGGAGGPTSFESGSGTINGTNASETPAIGDRNAYHLICIGGTDFVLAGEFKVGLIT